MGRTESLCTELLLGRSLTTRHYAACRLDSKCSVRNDKGMVEDVEWEGQNRFALNFCWADFSLRGIMLLVAYTRSAPFEMTRECGRC